MARLTAAARKDIPRKEFAVPGGVKGSGHPNFPLDTKAHDRSAIPLAGRSYAAGNISKSTERRIQSEARAKLGKPQKSAMGMGFATRKSV